MNRLLIKLLKYSVRWLAKYHRFIDPVDLLARLARFGQPSEVAVPTELLRAGARMHARGLLNSQAIQYNLDWIWPYWVDRQFDPSDESFVPRAFSLTHINLTHRNWTCVGQPGDDELPIVDPRGLITPFFDGWSLDFWVLPDDGTDLLFSGSQSVNQDFDWKSTPRVVTQGEGEGISLKTEVEVVPSRTKRDSSVCRVRVDASSETEGWLVTALRPYNPEGISTISRVDVKPDLTGWDVYDNEIEAELFFDPLPDRHAFSNFDRGDVYHEFPDPSPRETIRCDLGMISGAACYKLESGEPKSFEIQVPLDTEDGTSTPTESGTGWEHLPVDRCELEIPNKRYENLFYSSIKTLHLLSGEVVYPGPFTYKRFWFRDAAFMLNALIVTGYDERALRILNHFPREQRVNGYFCSQHGEWDSNGEALWIMGLYCDYTNSSPPEQWRRAIRSGAEWICNKRTDPTGNELHAGLLPAGFSAEHFGPNDYYYWDDYWSVSGLRTASTLLEELGESRRAKRFRNEAEDLLRSIERSMEPTLQEQDHRGMPPSPYRSVDAGSIGSIVAGYPHDIYPPGDDRLIDTVDLLMEEYFYEGVFFQEMIHSGKNPYLSLHIAQVLLKNSDSRFNGIVESVADMASDTGKWPEAVHPATGGGCMGDGEHGWAAAEWVLLIRNMFVREEGNELVLCQGLPRDWLGGGDPLRFGPTLTSFGEVTVVVKPGDGESRIELDANWHSASPIVTVRLPGHETVTRQDPPPSIRISEE